ncbi:MAG: AraC family transcriptional regulator [Erysipelotrichaceae bacterium]|nr:AraC family transcriptional regulator [Erysipelotrichaceae bacterium]
MFNFKVNKLDFSHKLGTVLFTDDIYEEHIHFFYEIIFFVNGSVSYTVQTKSKKLSPGDIILIHPGKVHYATLEKEENYERYVLKFPISVIPPFLHEKLSKIDSFLKKTKKYTYIFEKLDDYFEKYEEEEIYTLFVCELLRLCIFLCDDGEKEEKINSNQFINEIIEYVETHICENINLNSLSDHFYYSPSYLDYQFKKHMRMSLTKYIRNKKIYLAHEMIQSGMKASEVAEKVGFTDYSTFYRSYIKVMGFKPSNNNDLKII